MNNSLVTLVGLLGALTLLSLIIFLLITSWKKRIEKTLKQNRGELRNIKNNRKLMVSTAKAFSPDDPEPFGSLSESLTNELTTTDNQINELEEIRVKIREQITAINSNWFQKTIGALYYWYRVLVDAQKMQVGTNQLHETFNTSTAILRKLTKVPWEIAQQTREMKLSYGEVTKDLDLLLAKNVRGKSIESAVELLEDLKLSLNSIPGPYMDDDETELLKSADKISTISVFNRLVEIKPSLEDLSKRIRGWKRRFNEVYNQIDDLSGAITQLDLLWEQVPESLDLSAFTKEYQILKVIHNNLKDTATRLEIESMPAISTESTKILRTVQDMDSKLTITFNENKELQELIPSLSEDIKSTSTIFAELGTTKKHPVIWGRSKDKLAELSGALNSLPPVGSSRTPEEIHADLESARLLKDKQKSLLKHCQMISGLHAELKELLSDPNIHSGLEIRDQAISTLKKSRPYSDDNFIPEDSIHTLPDETQGLTEGLIRLIPEEPNEPVHEVELADLVDQIKRLSVFLKELKVRLNHIDFRVKEIHEVEKQTADRLKESSATMENITLIAGSNPFLDEHIGPEIEEINQALDAVGSGISHPETGIIEDKYQQVLEIIELTIEDGRGWISLLDDDIQTKKDLVVNKLDGLAHISNFNDPKLEQYRNLITEIDRKSGERLPRLTMDTLFQTIKDKNRTWQELEAAYLSITDIEGLIADKYNRAETHRKEAISILERITSHDIQSSIPGFSIDEENRELNRLELIWNGLKTQQLDVTSTASKYGSLALQYQSLIERVRHIVRMIDQERDQLSQIQTRINEILSQWEQRREEYQENPIALPEIELLLAESRDEMNRIIEDYSVGRSPSDTAIQALKQLEQKTLTTQIPIDESRIINTYGQVTSYR